MKKLGILLTFAFIGVTPLATAETTAAASSNCIDVTLSCGETYQICNSTGTTESILLGILAQDQISCGD